MIVKLIVVTKRWLRPLTILVRLKLNSHLPEARRLKSYSLRRLELNGLDSEAGEQRNADIIYFSKESC